MRRVEGLSVSNQKMIAQLALNYPPSTRALIGAMFEHLGNNSASEKLYKSLNQLSKYCFGINENTLPNKNKWNIDSENSSTQVPFNSKKKFTSTHTMPGTILNQVPYGVKVPSIAVSPITTQVLKTKWTDSQTDLTSQLKELKQLIDVHLSQCTNTYTPEVCRMIDTPEGKDQVHEKVLMLCLAKGCSVGQAVNEIEKDFNPNLRND